MDSNHSWLIENMSTRIQQYKTLYIFKTKIDWLQNASIFSKHSWLPTFLWYPGVWIFLVDSKHSWKNENTLGNLKVSLCTKNTRVGFKNHSRLIENIPARLQQYNNTPYILKTKIDWPQNVPIILKTLLASNFSVISRTVNVLTRLKTLLVES